jgi:hypothetical protein
MWAGIIWDGIMWERRPAAIQASINRKAVKQTVSTRALQVSLSTAA